MASEITICTNALLQLGSQPISSFTDGTDNALLCSNLYPQTRDGVLASAPFNRAIKRVSLAPSAVVPVWGYAFAFDMPGDLLTLLEVDTLGNHKVENGQILADENPLFIKYTFRNENVPSYSALMIEALTWAMMAVLAYPITKSTTKSTEINTIYLTRLRIARTVDAQEDSPDEMGESQLVRARRRSGGTVPNV
jgi:hypothetical protein